MRTDIENLSDGQRVKLHSLPTNPLHSKPVMATYSGGYFFCDGTDPTEGPDYYFRDVFEFNEGFTTEGN